MDHVHAQDCYRHALQTYVHPEMPMDQGIIAALHSAKVLCEAWRVKTDGLRLLMMAQHLVHCNASPSAKHIQHSFVWMCM